MRSRHRLHRNPLAILPVVAVLAVGSVACGSDEETFSAITETGITSATYTTDTTAGARPEPVDDTTTTTVGADEPATDHSPAYVNHVEVLVLESFPPQVSVEIEGDHPTPCHETLVEVTEDGNDYTVMVWSVAPEPGTVCAQVLEPFEEVVPIGNGFESGDYTVTVNGETHPFSI